MNEYFDILDENGNKTGNTKLRKEVHRDGDWHKAVHIWVLNENGDVLLQRRSADKDSNPNMLDISSAGHLSAGDESLTGAIRELKEELNIEVQPSELQFITTLKRASKYTSTLLKRASKYTSTFINNEFDDLYILRTNLKIEDMEYQREELQDLFYMPYKEFKKMVEENHPELLKHNDEFEILFEMFDREFDK